jgi:creatinine amidohydrolase/Fe(II)-dependent formamide hydrolase-like protein
VLFLSPSMIRRDTLAPGRAGDGSGTIGTPALATVEYGRQIVEMQFDAALRQLRSLCDAPR